MAQNIGTQAAFLGIRAGRLVVGDAMGRHQQGRDRVDQRRFAGTDVAGQQGVAAVEIQCPDPAVESAPVVDFQAL